MSTATMTTPTLVQKSLGWSIALSVVVELRFFGGLSVDENRRVPSYLAGDCAP